MLEKNIDKIKEREKTLISAQETLKKEFIGIDNVIDDIISNIRVWYIFPEMVSRPLVINLWGLTGCGKTSLVNRLCELLDVNDRTITYNLAKLDEDSSSELEDNINENVSCTERNPVFVFDEFQFAATKSEDGKEKDNKTALKTIWELIDSGMFRAKLERYVVSHYMTLSFIVSFMEKAGVKVENKRLVGLEKLVEPEKMRGEDKDSEDVLSGHDLKHLFNRYFNYNGGEASDRESWCDATSTYVYNDPSCWVSSQTIATLYSIWARTIDNSEDINCFIEKLKNMSMKEFVELLYRLENKVKVGFYHDYSGALIFVIGNVDEAYTMSYDMNPDMDADQFYEVTKKLSIVNIKEALKERFRNEQIARLGNIMLIYPSFSSENFTNIIKLKLSNYKKNVAKNFGIDIDFDDSIVDVIYKDGVFPAQGTRPVFSSIYEIVETKLPRVVLQAYNNEKYNISSILMSYKDNYVVTDIKFSDSDDTSRFEFKQDLKIEDLRKNKHDERQALTAVHESMHFVMYAKLFGKMPDKLVSSCASDDANGFMMEKVNENHFLSKNDYLKNIQVSLAGYVAERVVFGRDEYTSGASSDLVEATKMASRMVRSYGMSQLGAGVTTYLTAPSETYFGQLVNDDEANAIASTYITNILDECEKEVRETLNHPEWYNMFKESSNYLFENVSMSKEKMKEIYEHVSAETRKECVRDENYFRDRLKAL